MNDERGTHERPARPDDAHDERGVDLTLIRWHLSLSPAERLAVLQAQATSLAKMRDAAAG